MSVNTTQMKRFFTFAFFFLLVLAAKADDTLTVMHYNLLYYGVNTSFCTNVNNNIDVKNEQLKLILDEIKPAIFTVNEMSGIEDIQFGLMENTLNVDGTDYYQKASLSNQSGSGIVNMLYYDSRKLRLKAQHTAQSYIRDIDVYELYYYSNDLEQGDTSFVICAVAHLKAGNNAADAAKRTTMVENAMSFLEENYADENVLFMGDFNVYSGSEDAYQTLTNYSNANIRFIDPIDALGAWNNNGSFAGVHTQSTNSSSNGCASSGGMDDRFDFILISDELRFGVQSMRYVDDSYKAFGQDGLHFNSSINAPPANAAVSAAMADALQQMSDHLPVVLQLHVNKTLDLFEQQRKPFLASLNPNPVMNGSTLSFYQVKSGKMSIRLLSMQAKVIHEFQLNAQAGNNKLKFEIPNLPSGIYLLQLSSENGQSETLKLVKP